VLWTFGILVIPPTEQNLADIGFCNFGIFQSLLTRLNRAFDQVAYETLKFRARQFEIHVFWTGRVHRKVREVDVCLKGRREFDLSFFGCFFETLHGHGVLGNVDSLLFLEFRHQVIDEEVVEIFASQKGVAVSRFYFEYTFLDLQN
jgi:hypothetical protein